MIRHRITEAKEAANRFSEAVEQLEEREAKDEHFRRFMNITGFKETAAVRRASMDLTRALASMRKVQ